MTSTEYLSVRNGQHELVVKKLGAMRGVLYWGLWGWGLGFVLPEIC